MRNVVHWMVAGALLSSGLMTGILDGHWVLATWFIILSSAGISAVLWPRP